MAWALGLGMTTFGFNSRFEELTGHTPFEWQRHIDADQPASFVYFLTLYNIFKGFLEDIDDKRNLLASDRINFDVLNHTDLSRLNPSVA